MKRAEHLQWCKTRALEYVDTGDLDQAMASMLSDLNKHSETLGHSDGLLMQLLQLGGHLDSSHEMRKFIKDFN